MSMFLYDMAWTRVNKHGTPSGRIHLLGMVTKVALCGRPTAAPLRPRVAQVHVDTVCKHCLVDSGLVEPEDVASPDRRLRAEVRAVEEGHHAFKRGATRYTVKSDTYLDTTYLVEVHPLGELITFRCNCPNRQSRAPLCKHMQLVARRLEREGKAVLTNGEWRDPNYDPPPPPEDPFDHPTFYRG